MKRIITSIAAIAVSAIVRAGFTPSDVAGLELWLAADNGVLDAGGQTPANGATVAQWLDASGKTATPRKTRMATARSTRPPA